jgi:PAS domain S-box-containing protein
VNPDQSPGNFAEVNESAASMLGYTKEEFLSLNIFELEPGSSPAIAAERGSILLKDGYHSLETRFTHKNGHLIDVSLLIILTAYPQQAS